MANNSVWAVDDALKRDRPLVRPSLRKFRQKKFKFCFSRFIPYAGVGLSKINRVVEAKTAGGQRRSRPHLLLWHQTLTQRVITLFSVSTNISPRSYSSLNPVDLHCLAEKYNDLSLFKILWVQTGIQCPSAVVSIALYLHILEVIFMI
jgi:hypothetical protein